MDCSQSKSNEGGPVANNKRAVDNNLEPPKENKANKEGGGVVDLHPNLEKNDKEIQAALEPTTQKGLIQSLFDREYENDAELEEAIDVFLEKVTTNEKVRKKIEDIAKELIRIKLLKPTTKGFRTEVAEVALDAIGVVYCKCVQGVKKVKDAGNSNMYSGISNTT